MQVDKITTFLMTVFLSIGGSWYLQINLSIELKGQVMDHITEHAKELIELRLKVNTQAAEIKKLKDDNKEQNKFITEQTKQITDHNKFIAELKVQIMIYEKYFKVSI